MPPSDSQSFLHELDMNGAERHGRPSNAARRVRAGARIKLWTAADKLRSNLDAAVYKHAVPALTKGSTDIPVCSSPSKKGNTDIPVCSSPYKEAIRPDHAKPKLSNKGSTDIPVCSTAYEEAIRAELEERDYYIERNVFWVPALARWKTLQDCHARMRSCKMRSHPAERPRSGGYSAKLPAGTEILRERGFATRSYKITSTGKLIDLIATIPFQHAEPLQT